jgi:hypothetical protein
MPATFWENRQVFNHDVNYPSRRVRTGILILK